MSHHKFVVYGGGVSAWVTAAALANAYSPDAAEIILVNPGIATKEPSFADSCLASVRRFHANMRISERELMHLTAATFKVGVKYQNWSAMGQSFFHSLSAYGNMLDGIDFHQYAILMHQCGDKTSFESYSLAAQAVRIGKFGFPGKDLIDKGFSLDYTLHVDLVRYTEVMKDFAIKKNVCVVSGELNHLILSDTGGITSIVLEGGVCINGDLFFDCSGAGSALIGELEGDQFMSWHQQLPVNKQASVIVHSPLKSGLATHLCAHQYGWIKAVPLRNKTLYSLSYSNDYVMDDEATSAVVDYSGAGTAKSVTVHSCSPGRRQKVWLKNCVAIGTAAGEFSDLTVSYLHHVQSGILRFIDLYSMRGSNDVAAHEYNQLTAAEYSRVLDYHQLNLLLVSSQTFDFWKGISAAPSSEELLHKIALFKHRGKLAFYEYETWMPAAWISLFLGNDFWPEKHDILLEDCKLESVVNRLAQMKMAYSNLAEQLPNEHDFLNRYTTLG